MNKSPISAPIDASRIKNSRFFLEAKKRLLGHLIAVFFLWPLTSALMATLAALGLPYLQVTLGQALLAAVAGMAVLMPDIAIVGGIGLLACLTLFSSLASLNLIKQNTSLMGFIAEPVIILFTLLFGISLYYPAILAHPGFTVLGFLPVWVLISALALITAGWGLALASPGHKASVVATLLICAVLAPLPCLWRNHRAPVPAVPPPLVLLGIDSLSLSDDLSHIRQWTLANGGAWYTYAVSPGLLTNAVWTSILLIKPVREHAIFHTFQSSVESSSNSLVEQAKKQGYYTVSMFPDQLTCWLGSEYAFDLDLSGPVGWRQLATSTFENASVVLPLFRPSLPRLPFSSVPPNHAGTFTYSIDREFNEMLSQSSAKGATLVMGHSTYLHLASYPKYFDLSLEECRKVLNSQAGRVKDRSFDWQDVDRPDDAIPIRRWKVMRVQSAIANALERSKFLERGGKMILISDHGDRVGLSPENFHEERYHRVMFATFGLPRRNASMPISVIDSGSILGLAEHRPFEPIVEYAMGDPAEWPLLMQSVRLRWDGSVHLDPDILSTIFTRLRSHRPWPTTGDSEHH